MVTPLFLTGRYRCLHNCLYSGGNNALRKGHMHTRLVGTTVPLKGNVALARHSYPQASNAHVSSLNKLAHTRTESARVEG